MDDWMSDPNWGHGKAIGRANLVYLNAILALSPAKNLHGQNIFIAIQQTTCPCLDTQ